MKNNKTEEFAINRINILKDYLKKYYQESSNYDYLVMFSGGKDSTYLAALMKQMPGGRVLCLAINNGYEHNNFDEYVTKVAESIKCDIMIIKPNKDDFLELYKEAIHNSYFRLYDSNPICFLCEQYLQTIALEYADVHNIPVVIHGCSPSQFNINIPSIESFGIKYTDNYIKMLEKAMALKGRRTLSIQRELLEGEQYSYDKKKKELFERWYKTEHNAKIVFPFLFINYDIEEILKTLKQNYNWKNGAGICDDKYITSGCRMTNLFEALQNKGIIEIHEDDEYINDLKNGKMRLKRFIYNYKPHVKIKRKEYRFTPDNEQLLIDLGLESMFKLKERKEREV